MTPGIKGLPQAAQPGSGAGMGEWGAGVRGSRDEGVRVFEVSRKSGQRKEAGRFFWCDYPFSD